MALIYDRGFFFSPFFDAVGQGPKSVYFSARLKNLNRTNESSEEHERAYRKIMFSIYANIYIAILCLKIRGSSFLLLSLKTLFSSQWHYTSMSCSRSCYLFLITYLVIALFFVVVRIQKLSRFVRSRSDPRRASSVGWPITERRSDLGNQRRRSVKRDTRASCSTDCSTQV